MYTHSFINRRIALCASVFALLLSANTAIAQVTPTTQTAWENISDPILQRLTREGIETDWPGDTAGVTVDPSTGDVYVIVAGQGVWRSSDAGKTFARCDDGKVGGRCESSFSLTFDLAGKRLACFMLDGKGAWTLDGGETWRQMADVGRNWDYAAVDWSTPQVKNIFAGLHESGGQVMKSNDGGQSWVLLFKDAEFDKSGGLGIFDERTLVFTQKGKGIQRSTDGGETWTKIADFEPIGRLVQILDGKAYWLAREGILVSTDKGATWTMQGKPVEATAGPMLDPKNEKRIVVAGANGIHRSSDGGETWTFVAKMPAEGFDFPKAGWYTNVAWDPVHDILYASKMGKPTYRLETKP